MRSGFTLIEVLVATVIATFAGLALLQVNSSNTLLFSKLQGLSESSEELSLIGAHADQRFNRTTKSLYDILDREYDITNDDFRKYLKEVKYDYKESLIDTIVFGENDMDSETEALYENDLENNANVPLLQFELLKITIRNDESHGAILKIRSLL